MRQPLRIFDSCAVLQKWLVRPERQLVAVVQLDHVRLVEGGQALLQVAVEVVHRAPVAGVRAIRPQRERLREHVRSQERQARPVTLLAFQHERVVARSSAPIAAIGARVDVEVLRKRSQGLPHGLRAWERRIWIGDVRLPRQRRVHARVHQIDGAGRPVLLDEAVKERGVDLIEAQEVRRQVSPELPVVARLYGEATG